MFVRRARSLKESTHRWKVCQDRWRTSSASLNRFSRVHEVGPMVHTILVFLNVLESWESLRCRKNATASSDKPAYSH